MGVKRIQDSVLTARVFALLILLSLLGSCGSTGQPGSAPSPAGGNSSTPGLSGPTASPTGPFPIATPSQVFDKLRGVKQASWILNRDASDFVAGFSQQVLPVAPELIYSPQWVNGYSAFDTVSYAIYRFDLTGRVGRPVINTDWSHAPADYKLLWLGASNWQKDCWDWYSGAPAGVVQAAVGSLDMYKHPSTNEMYVAVVMLGQGSAMLREIWLSGFSMRGDWWMYGRNATHNSCSPFIGPDSPAVKWQLRLGKDANGCPAVYDVNDTLYIAATSSPTAPYHDLYALHPDGTQEWMLQLPSSGSNAGFSPALGDDGSIYYAMPYGNLYSLNPDNSQRWIFAGHNGMASPPAIGLDGTIYVIGAAAGTSLSRYLYAVNTDGILRWEYDFTTAYPNTPAIADDGTVYTWCSDGKLYAFNTDGSVKWNYATAGSGGSSNPVTDKNGRIYLANREPKLYCINPDGTLAWSSQTEALLSGPLALAADGVVYGSSGSYLYSFDSTGSLRWKFYLAGGGQPAIDAAGAIYVASGDSRLYALHPDGTLKWWFVASAHLRSTPVIAGNGTIYVMDDDGILYAIGPGGLLHDHTASGYIQDSGGIGIPGVTVTITGEEPVITDSNGFWSKGGLVDGAYLVSPSLAGYKFSPLFDVLTVSGADASMPDFTGAPLGPPVWPMFGSNLARTRCSSHTGPATPVPLWTVSLAEFEEFSTEPAIAGDGAVYLQGASYGSLCALNPDGSERWRFDSGFASDITPAIAADGTVYTSNSTFLSEVQLIRAFTPGGVFKWSRDCGTIVGSPLVTADGAIINYTSLGFLALNPDGTQRWLSNLAKAGAPAIAADGTIYAFSPAFTHAAIVALNPDGSTKQWDYQVDWPLGGGFALGADGTVFCGLQNGFYALNPDGTFKWLYGPDLNTGVPAIAPDGTIFFATGTISYPDTNKLIALNPDGSLKWEYFADGYAFSSPPTVDASGTVYIGITALGAVRAINPDGTLKWSFDDPPADTGGIAIGADGTLYFGDSVGHVFAIGPGAG